MHSALRLRLFVPAALLVVSAAAEAQSVAVDPRAARAPVGLPAGLLRAELAGDPLSAYPFFHFVRAFHEGSTLCIAVDPWLHPSLVGRTADVYVVAAKSDVEWMSDLQLVDARGAPQSVSISAANVQANTFVVDAGTLNGFAGTDLGVGYDVVLDCDLDGFLSPGDAIDGLGPEAGCYVVRDTTVAGPLAVTEALYTGGTFLGQDLYYPTDIATLGALPLVVVSHGNGHNYKWYDHIGFHLASYGCVVMSHQNDTMPGIETASTTTLTNTDYLLGNLATIEGGVLDGHVDSHRITWIGHSRGGEGVVRAYRRVVSGQFVPANFTASDVVLVSSICPVTFLSAVNSDPGTVAYHFLYTPSDSDVTGSPGAGDSKPFVLYERARGEKVSNYVHGAGHANFHNGGGFCWCTGPDLIGTPATHQVVRGYYLPLVKRFVEENVPARDFFERNFEDFRPKGIPGNVTMANEHRLALATPRFVIDDFQSQPALVQSSSGGRISTNAAGLAEDLMRDTDGSFVFSSSVPMNGMTRWRDTPDDFRCAVLEWDPAAPGFFELGIVPAERDLSDDLALCFRVCQGTRHPATDLLDAPLSLTVSLIDGVSRPTSIAVASYGTVPRTYERVGSGIGAGWANEFSSFKIRLTDFLANGSMLDLTDVHAVRFSFGPGLGSDRGRIGLDDIEIVKE